MIYLASPYSSPDPTIVKTRVGLVQDCLAALLGRGIFAWSPIAQTHEVAQRHNLPGDAEFWKAYNFDFMRRADAIYVLVIPGWRESKGVQMEIKFAIDNLIPLVYVDHEGNPAWLVSSTQQI